MMFESEIIGNNLIQLYHMLEQSDFVSRNGSIQYSIEMDRNLQTSIIDTIIIKKENGLETVYLEMQIRGSSSTFYYESVLVPWSPRPHEPLRNTRKHHGTLLRQI